MLDTLVVCYLLPSVWVALFQSQYNTELETGKISQDGYA